MWPLPSSATNKSPTLLKARPLGRYNPEAKMLCVPLGVNSVMLVGHVDTNKFCAFAGRAAASAIAISNGNTDTRDGINNFLGIKIKAFLPHASRGMFSAFSLWRTSLLRRRVQDLTRAAFPEFVRPPNPPASRRRRQRRRPVFCGR